LKLLENVEGFLTKPLPLATKHDVQDFIVNQATEFMELMKDDTGKLRYPFLHPIQAGIEANMFVWWYDGKFGLVINPKYIVRNRKFVKPRIEASLFHLTDEGKPKVFLTERATPIMAMYDTYTPEGTLVRESQKFENDSAMAFAVMTDLSNNKHITRFKDISK